MFTISLWIYTAFMVFIWGFFLVAKVHFFKYREYSRYVVPATRLMMLVLSVLTILGLYFIYKYTWTNVEVQSVQEQATNEVY